MNTAITLNPDAPLAELIALVQSAEELGFSYCYIADQGFSRDVYVTLSALGGATRRIRLGPGVTHPYTRHPVATAVAVATLDELSNGRAFLGLGAGGSRSLVPMQLERTNPLRACRETVEIARALWSGKAVNYQGELFKLADGRVNFSCRPDIEVHWAARGPKMLALGGEVADVNILHGIPFFEIANVVAQVRAGAKRAGRATRLQFATTLVYDQASRESARMRTVYRLVDSAEHVKARLGLTAELVDEMRRLVTTQGPKAAAHLVSDEILSHYVLEGDPQSCAAALRQLFAAHGLDGLTVEVPDPIQAKTLLPLAAKMISQI